MLILWNSKCSYQLVVCLWNRGNKRIIVDTAKEIWEKCWLHITHNMGLKRWSQGGTSSAKLWLILVHLSLKSRFSADIYYIAPWNRQAAALQLCSSGKIVVCKRRIHLHRGQSFLGGRALCSCRRKGMWEALLLSALNLIHKCILGLAFFSRIRVTGSVRRGGKKIPRQTTYFATCILHWLSKTTCDPRLSRRAVLESAQML